MEFTMMTFNLRVNTEADGPNAWPFRADAAARAIRESGASVVGTQESLHGMLLDLERRIPEFGWVGQGRYGGQEGEYAAILYNREAWSVAESGHFWLSEQPEVAGSMSWGTHYTRICTWALLQSLQEDGGALLVANTHLDNGCQEARENGARLIADRLAELRGAYRCPCVLLGDLNAQPDNPVIGLLQGDLPGEGQADGLRNVYAVFSGEGAEIGCTYHGYGGGEAGQPIDYMFATPELRAIAVRVIRSMFGGRYPSDHYPVVACMASRNR